MNIRQRITTALLLFLILVTFASYSQGSVVWLQWLTVVALVFFSLSFDLLFTSDSSFIFDPDADNWRRKTVRRPCFVATTMTRQTPGPRGMWELINVLLSFERWLCESLNRIWLECLRQFGLQCSLPFQNVFRPGRMVLPGFSRWRSHANSGQHF
jgi:hypothetical protein